MTLEEALPPPQPERAIARHGPFLGVLALSAVLYLWNLTISGYANTYYAMAAQAAATDWGAFFFGSLDAGNFITLDKPPATTWLIGLSVKVLGLSSWSILLPQALLGVASVGVLYLTVRRAFGTPAAVVAGLVMALTPAATLIFRYDNPDALLTFLLVLAAWALLRGTEDGPLRWPMAAAALVGFAFLTKYLQAYVVLPAFALTWFVAAPGSARRRIGGLAPAAATVVVTSGWWVAIVALIPAANRPYIGGSTNNSVLDLILGYDGLGRIFGQGIGGATITVDGAGGGRGGGGGFGGAPGLLRLFNEQFGGEISWLVPLALLGLVVAIVVRRGEGRRDPRLAQAALWGGWLVVHAVVFSFMSGIAHPYYTVVLAPAIGALVAMGLTELWGRRDRVQAQVVLGLGLVGSAALGAVILARYPEYATGPGPLAVVLALVAALLLLIGPRAVPSVVQRGAVAMGVAAILIGPAAFSVSTTGRALSGGDPTAGPASASSFGGGPGGPQLVASVGGDGAGGTAASQELVDYLLANRGSATWIVAASGSQAAAEIQLLANAPVMAMGGFSGGDAAPTLDQLQARIASGELRFVLAGGRGGRGGGFVDGGQLPGPGDGQPGDGIGTPGGNGFPGGGPGGNGGPTVGPGGQGGPGGRGTTLEVMTWVRATCAAVTVGSATVYDCAGAA